jgi:hypothetical protein
MATQPDVKTGRGVYERAIREELAYWPGVEVAFGQRSKHRTAILHYRTETRFVVYPDTPSDTQRGHLNCIANVRKELRALGAERVEQRPKKRNRGPRVIGRHKLRQPEWARRTDLAPVKPNPFDALQALAKMEAPLADHRNIRKPSGEYLYEFEMGGARYSFAMYADDWEDAERRLRAIRATATLSGGPAYRIPANSLTLPFVWVFVELFTRIKNALR